MYAVAKSAGAKSWNQIEAQFLQDMWAFDSSVASTAGRQDMTDEEKTALSGDLQNGKGDFFNDLLARLLERVLYRACTDLKAVAKQGSK
jgi:hypothetical protein